MRKEVTYKEKFALLQPWLPVLIASVKRDLKNDHLRRDPQFCKRFLAGKNPVKVAEEDLVEAYKSAIAESENGEAIAEFIANRWLLKHGDIYSFFEQQLSAIARDFTEIEELPHEDSKRMSEAAVAAFGAQRSYLFAILNSVVFPETIFQTLAKQAEQSHKHEEEERLQFSEKAALDQIVSGYEQQMARLIDKYEKKLGGLQKKYLQDTDALKKQISQLQRKLSP